MKNRNHDNGIIIGEIDLENRSFTRLNPKSLDEIISDMDREYRLHTGQPLPALRSLGMLRLAVEEFHKSGGAA